MTCSSKSSDALKNDFQNARKRNLHLWMKWRSDVNDQLATSLFTGKHKVDVEPLDAYLHKTDHPSENPKTLLTYSASVDNISSLGVKRFLHFGIPRVKIKKRTSKIKDDYLDGDSSGVKSQANTIKSKSHFSQKSKSVSSKKSRAQRLESLNVDFRSSTSAISIQDGPPPDSMGHMFLPDIPYHEPEPDYSSNNQESSSPDPGSPGPGSSFDNITSPGTSYADNESSSSCESEPEDCPYLRRQKQAELFASNTVKKRISTISRTYSTMDALDPVYIKSSELKKSKPKKSSKKDKDPPHNGSWKSFDSSITSAKSAQRKSKKSSFFNLFKKFQSSSKSKSQTKSQYGKSSDIKSTKLQDILEEETNNNDTEAAKMVDSQQEAGDQGNHVIYARPEDIREKKVYSRKNSKKEQHFAKTLDPRQGNVDIYARAPIYPDTRHPSILGDPRYVSTGDIRASTTKSKWSYFGRDSRTSEYARVGDLRHYTPGAGMGGSSMDLYTTGMVERLEFTREPRRVGFRDKKEEKRSQSQVYDNWGFH